MRLLPHKNQGRSGFTLAEAAITIAIVGLTITYTLRALTAAQTTAAHTHEVKLAREMALRTLGEISTGQYIVDSGEVLTGTYDEEIAPYMSFEAAFGDATLPARSRDENGDQSFDNWQARDQYRQENDINDDVEGDHEPFEKVIIRVSFAKHSDLPDFIELESWIPWEQVYGLDDELDPSAEGDENEDSMDEGEGGENER